MSKYGHRPINWFKAIVNKIGGEDAADRFLRGELTIRVMENFFPVWKTLILGRPVSVNVYRAIMSANDCRMDHYTSQMLDKVIVSSAETEVDLVNISVADLGFRYGAIYAAICTRAKDFGLERCPAEVGLNLRLEYTDQPYGESLHVAMKAITDWSDRLAIFKVVCDGDIRRLDASNGDPGGVWGDNDRFVFVQPRN